MTEPRFTYADVQRELAVPVQDPPRWIWGEVTDAIAHPLVPAWALVVALVSLLIGN